MLFSFRSGLRTIVKLTILGVWYKVVNFYATSTIRESTSLLGPVDPSFRALEFTVRRHEFNKDSFYTHSWRKVGRDQLEHPLGNVSRIHGRQRYCLSPVALRLIGDLGVWARPLNKSGANPGM